MIRSLAMTITLLAALMGGRSAAAADHDDAGGQQAMMAAMQPGPQHAAMAKCAGKYTVTGKLWMDPAKPPVPTTGTAEYTMILDGHYLRSDYTGEMMGKPFIGIGIDGYDNVLKKYTSVWIDSMSTATMFMTGQSEDDGKTITYLGEMSCPKTGGPIKSRVVITHTSDDSFTFVMFNTMTGKEAKCMELVYTRAK